MRSTKTLAVTRRWIGYNQNKATYFVNNIGWNNVSRLTVGSSNKVEVEESRSYPSVGRFVINTEGKWKPAAFTVSRLVSSDNHYLIFGPGISQSGNTMSRSSYRSLIGTPAYANNFRVNTALSGNQLHLGFWLSAFVSPVKDYFANNFMINFILMIPEEVHDEIRKELNGENLRDLMVIENLLCVRASKLQLWVDERYRTPTDAGPMTTERNRLKNHIYPSMMELGVKIIYKRQVDIQKDLTAFRMPEYKSLDELQLSKQRLLADSIKLI